MTDDDREMGVDFGDLEEKLGNHDYPADTEELLDEYGDETLTRSEERRVGKEC